MVGASSLAWSSFEPLANHLWQSTLVLAVIASLAVMLRHNRAQVRHWLWLFASVKFVIPFAMLAAIGSTIVLPVEHTAASDFVAPVAVVAEPFGPVAMSLADQGGTQDRAGTSFRPAVIIIVWFAGALALLARWSQQWLAIGRIAADGTPATGGREVRLLRALEARARHRRPLPIVIAESTMEPGVFGLWRPVLLWPRGMSARLDDRQVEAILAHELAHVRRHDNLTALVHMTVQAVFWFHPLVWWLGARLIEERERACDEDVLRLGSDPETYAQSILETCRFQLESPVACVSGVTGSNLRKRIEQIMTQNRTHFLTVWRKVLLAGVALVALVGPVLAGSLQSDARTPGVTPVPAEFDVASVKENISGDNRITFGLQGERFTAVNVPMRELIRFAYGVQPSQIEGGADWMASRRFDVIGKIPAGANAAAMPPGQIGPVNMMVRDLLEKRFKLVVERPLKDSQTYELVLARSDGKLGPRLEVSKTDCAALMAARRGGGPPAALQQPGEREQCGMFMTPNRVQAGASTLAQLAQILSQRVGRIVTDRTGLTGNYDFTLEFTPDPGMGAGPGGPGGPGDALPGAPPLPVADPNAPSIFTALQEQLGLKLESRRQPVEMLFIKSVELPTPD